MVLHRAVGSGVAFVGVESVDHIILPGNMKRHD
jgi:hypothetical protein